MLTGAEAPLGHLSRQRSREARQVTMLNPHYLEDPLAFSSVFVLLFDVHISGRRSCGQGYHVAILDVNENAETGVS